MNLKELANFIRIIEAGSMSKAASSLNLAQTALGLQVRNLESEFKHMLLRRHSRGVQPTEAGAILLLHAQNIMGEVRRAHDRIAQLNVPGGRVTLGMATSASRLFLTKLYLRCREQFPGIILDVVEAASSRLIQMNLNGELQLSCIYSIEDVQGLSTELVAKDEWVLVVSGSETSASKEVSFEEISTYPLILPSGQSGMRHRLTEEAHARGFTLNVVLEVQSETLVLQLVNQGFGATFLPFHAVREGVEAGIVRTYKINNPTFPSHMYLAYAPKFPLNASAQSVMALLRDIAKERFPLPVAANGGSSPDQSGISPAWAEPAASQHFGLVGHQEPD